MRRDCGKGRDPVQARCHHAPRPAECRPDGGWTECIHHVNERTAVTCSRHTVPRFPSALAIRLALALLPWAAVTAADATTADATAALADAGAAAAAPARKTRENPLTAGLIWLARHQRDDGSWNGAAGTAGPAGGGVGDNDLVATALAVLCFVASGYDHQTPNLYRTTVRQAYAYILAHQQGDGGFGGTISTALGTAVLDNAIAMTGDASLQDPAMRGLSALRARQLPGGAWDAAAMGAEGDVQATAWCLLAELSGQAARFPASVNNDAVNAWLTTTFQAANPGWQSFDPGLDRADFPARAAASAAAMSASATPASATASAGSAIAAARLVTALVAIREAARDPIPQSASGAMPADALVAAGFTLRATMFATLSNRLVSPEAMQAANADAMTAYLGTLSLVLQRGSCWDPWYANVCDPLRSAQHGEPGDREGSWDPPATAPALTGGRAAVTALHILTLQLCLRYYAHDR